MDLAEIKDKKIAVLLSGGVDSSVVVHEFASLGLHPDCFYIKIGPEEQEEWDCSSEEDLEMATAVAHKYGCKLQVVDCHKEYWTQVTRYTMEKVKAGFTPNPDVMCNRLVKFGAFNEKMGHNYDLIATGHYAQTECIDGKKWLTTSPDPVKDQTDFLAQIYDWQLKKAIFPIGHYQKGEVREIAEREHLVNAKRRDSQGICFLGQSVTVEKSGTAPVTIPTPPPTKSCWTTCGPCFSARVLCSLPPTWPPSSGKSPRKSGTRTKKTKNLRTRLPPNGGASTLPNGAKPACSKPSSLNPVRSLLQRSLAA